MIHPRPPYNAPGTAMEKSKFISVFSKDGIEMPKPDYQITPLENFRRVAERKDPLWIPNTLMDFQKLRTRGPLLGAQSGVVHASDFSDKSRYIDWFGVDWVWVASAGGAMLTPGTKLLEDITDWEKGVKFPDLDSIDWQSQVDYLMKNEYDPTKVMDCDVGAGCTERLVSVLGGYTETMLALAVEPEAVKDFFDCYSDFMIRFMEKLFSFFPVTMITLHDDWGTERDTFFSNAMMEELVFEPTKRMVDFVRSNGVRFNLHSCGNITRFIPYMIDMDIDFMQIQRRAVDIPMVKEKYGDRIGIDTGIEGLSGRTIDIPRDELLSCIRNTVDLYGKNGGFITSIQPSKNLENNWDAIFELYCHSREFYDSERQ